MRVVYQFGIVGILAGAATAAWFALAPAQEANGGGGPPSGGRPAAVELAEATTGTVRDTIEIVGSTRASRSVDLVPVVAGRIARIGVEEGAEVQAGQVLYELDAVQSRAAVREAEAELENLRTQLDRARRLSSSSAVSEASVDTLASQTRAAEARLAAARADLDDRRIKAPFEGVLGLSDISEGAYVTPGTVLTTLDDLTPVELEFSVPENLFGRAKAGAEVVARSEAFPGRAFEGRVAQIGTRVDRQSRAFTLRADLPNPERLLPQGLFMTGELVLERRDGAVLAPLEALIVEGGSTFVFKVEDGKALRTEVVVGERQAEKAEIKSGLAPGDSVVVRGQGRLRDGAPVLVPDPNNDASVS